MKETPVMASRRKQDGLTLIELLVVITILGFLATITTVKVFDIVEEGRVTKTQADIDAFKNALKQYRLHYGKYPSTSQGLIILTEPTDRRPEGYLENFNENDAWGNPYEYSSDGRKFLIVSYGADGMEGGEGTDADIRSDDTETGTDQGF
jgi:general secretion pathway protein G